MSLSSVESEYYSMARCASEAIGLANMIRELGHEARGQIWADAAAARGLALRSGSGAIKHTETKYFWLQQKEKNPGAPDRKDAWNSQSRRSDDEASGWKALGDAV